LRRENKGVCYTVFDTAIGACGIAWREVDSSKVIGFQLPEATAEATEARMVRWLGGNKAEPPEPIACVIDRVRRHLLGECDDFLDIGLDYTGVGDFERRVYEHSRTILPGATSTYGEIAKSLGQPGSARAVGQALGRNPLALIVPCHRVLAAGQQPGGFSAPGGRSTKARLLNIERAILTLDL
jgi:O-6-methylguanine DNA methyltransferase